MVFQKAKELEIENERKQKLLKMTVSPEHGVDTGGEPKDPEVKKKRDFIKKVEDFFPKFLLTVVYA